MPTYAYSCSSCGFTFDARQSMWEDPLTSCPQCDGRLRKLITAPLVVLGGACGSGPAAAGGCCGPSQ